MNSVRLSLTVAVILPLGIPAAMAFDVPPNEGFVTQVMMEAGAAPILSNSDESVLENLLSQYEQSTSNEIAIYATDTLRGESIEEVANTLFRAWGIGKEQKNNGILIVLAAADHLVRIEVGYGLEGAVPDIVGKGVIDADMTPAFQEGKYAEGLTSGFQSLVKHIGGEYSADRYQQNDSDAPSFIFFLFFLVIQALGSWMASTKSWWLGGVLGGVFGIIAAVAFNWWLSIPVCVAFGLIVDYVLSKTGISQRRRRHRTLWGGGFGGGGFGGGGGGFGGFGGGSSGGGGATGRW